ncbi:hypothetical protein BGZ51_000862 [Haplosporangium sp. Z 767]|nr:hypothetical protein BGZ51_000862 [Haplosporangium sp. Z 767]KAF9190707.1 hypothetical protein BGZ50_009848 [Haplosporangium sp. Z 11]
MAHKRVRSLDSTLDDSDDAAESMSQLESFPPLFGTRPNVMNSPSLRYVEPMDTTDSIHPDKDQVHRRWYILALSCMLLFGNYFAYDNPAALNTQLQKYLEIPYNDYQYLLSTLYSVYSLPNTVLPFLFGSLVDRFGPRKVLLVLSGCACLGQTIFSIGVQSRQIWMMLVGRAIFGVGGESCGVAQASITTMHFRGHELAFALGLNLCIARFGSVINTLVTPWAEQQWDVPTAIWIGTLSCVVSFLAAVLLVIMISQSTLISVATSKQYSESTPLLQSNSGTFTGTHAAISMDEDDVPSSPAIIHHLLRREISTSDSVQSARFTPGHVKAGSLPTLHIVTDQSPYKRHGDPWWGRWWDDLRVFPLSFWLICALIVLLYGTVVPFNNIASDFLQSKWFPGNPRKAAALMGIPDTLGAVLVPGFGLLVDRYGRRASTLIWSALTMVIVHMTLGFTPLNPIFAFTLLGIAYSMYGVALWPSIACVVTNELHLGKAYGISSSFLNISLTVVPFIVATIRVVGESFIPVEMFFVSMGLCGIAVGFMLKGIDRRDGGALEEPEILVDVPVIVPQTSLSTAASSTASPVVSQGRARFAKRQRPRLDILQSSEFRPQRSVSESGQGILKRWRDEEQDGDTESGTLGGNQGGSHDTTATHEGSDGHFATAGFAQGHHGDMSMSPLTDQPSRHRKWHSRSLLQRTLTRMESPLLQQCVNSPLYGSFSSPSLSTAMVEFPWDVAEATIPVIEGYSVSQHPILYNPLRGSSGSFRISRNARPIAFGDGEEGLLYINDQMVDPGDENDDGTEDATLTNSNNEDVEDRRQEIDP